MEKAITFACPEEVLLTLTLSPEAFAQEVQLLAALKLYEQGRLSSGLAAKLAGLPRARFLLALGEHRIPLLEDTDEEFRREWEHA